MRFGAAEKFLSVSEVGGGFWSAGLDLGCLGVACIERDTSPIEHTRANNPQQQAWSSLVNQGRSRLCQDDHAVTQISYESVEWKEWIQ